MKLSRYVNIFITLTFLVAGGIGSWHGYKQYITPPERPPFSTQKAERRNIKKVVLAEGTLEASGTSKIGSLISAKVKKIHVKEDQQVKQGTLLAELENNNGGDTLVRQAQAQVERAQATLAYLERRYAREKALFESGQRSHDNFEQITRDYQVAKAAVTEAQAAHEREQFLFDQTQVKAPHNGIIVSIPTKVGEAFSPFTSPPQVLFELAESINSMKATLYIDENKIGDITRNMQARIKVDAYPDKKPWKGRISSISLGKSRVNQKSTQRMTNAVMYEAEVTLDNSNRLLRPDMSVNAEITIGKTKQSLAIPGFVFQLNPSILEQAAQLKGYRFTPLEPTEKKQLIKQSTEHPVKTVWVVKEKNIIEKAVTIGVTDNAFFEILSGLDEQDEIISDDMAASEEVKKIAQAVAGS